MKKYIFTAGIIILSLTSLKAQNIKYGVKAGTQLSNFIGKDLENKSVVNAFGGLYANIKLSEKLFVQPELLYSIQGAKSTPEYDTFGGEGVTDMDERIKLDYLNIPIMLQYAVAKNVCLEIGPQVGILLNSEAELDATITTGVGISHEKETFDLKDYANTLDLGLNLGGVYTMDNGLNFTLRYSLGLTSIGDKDAKKSFTYHPPTDIADTKNSVLSLGVGYSF